MLRADKQRLVVGPGGLKEHLANEVPCRLVSQPGVRAWRLLGQTGVKRLRKQDGLVRSQLRDFVEKVFEGAVGIYGLAHAWC